MSSKKAEVLEKFFENLSEMNSDQMMNLVGKYLQDDEIEHFVEHIEEFYDIHEEEELGTLAQIMITGYLVAQYEFEQNQTRH